MPSENFIKNQEKVPMIYRRHGDTTPKKKTHVLGMNETRSLSKGINIPETEIESKLLDPPQAPTKNFVPRFLETDRQVLSFESFFLEAVHESAVENFRVRKCDILFYIEDDSLQVVEPKIENSGMTQGNLIKRHRISKGDSYYSFSDLNVGEEVTFYGKTFHIVNADPYTRKFMKEKGIILKEAEDYPMDAFEKKNQKKNNHETGHFGVKNSSNKVFMEAKLGKFIRPSDHLRRFLVHNRQVLRWYALWDDTISEYGLKHHYAIHYFLSDDTVEIREIHGRNSGCDPFPKLLNKTRLLKNSSINDSDYYSWKDFILGKKINVFGRFILLTSVDEFTRDYFQEQGIELGKAIDVSEQPKEYPPFVPPPHNGIGSEEDSLGSCYNLVAKKPKESMEKLINKRALIFSGVMKTTKPEDIHRRFVLSFFVADNQFQIMEDKERNSGIVGGKFLEKGNHKKTNGQKFNPEDFYVGAEINVHGHTFILDGIDEYSSKYMQENKSNFPRADVDLIMNNIRQVEKNNSIRFRQAFQSFQRQENIQRLGFDDLKKILCPFLPDISDHEILTLLRSLPINEEGTISLKDWENNVLCSSSSWISESSNDCDPIAITKRVATIALGQQSKILQKFRLADPSFSSHIDRITFIKCLSSLEIIKDSDLHVAADVLIGNKRLVNYNECLHAMEKIAFK